MLEWQALLTGSVVEGPLTADALCAVLPPRVPLVTLVPNTHDEQPFIDALVTERRGRRCVTRNVSLGRSAVLLDAVEDLLMEVTGRALPEDVFRASRVLYDQLWAPLGVDRRREVWVVPAPELALAPLAAMVSPRGDWVVERQVVRQLDSLSHLLEPQPSPSNTALVLGGFDYGEGTRPPGGLDCLPERWVPLEGAASEASAVAGMLGGAWGPQAVRQLGDNASLGTVAGLVDAVPGVGVLHLATHGFMADADCVGSTVNLAGVIDPMFSAGLVLDGANTRPAGGEADGLLLAHEVERLDLSGTGLVVLSACDSGSGHINPAVGVVGLRRGFARAGARQVLMTLWSVEDEATRELMESFYAAWLTEPDAAKALTTAQRALLTRVRAEQGEDRPDLWAPFLVAGPPR